jgi:hypothetical protein
MKIASPEKGVLNSSHVAIARNQTEHHRKKPPGKIRILHRRGVNDNERHVWTWVLFTRTLEAALSGLDNHLFR